MRTLVAPLIALLLLGSCGSPPKPPSVDESRKRPVNTASALELQSCKTDLSTTRVAASESSRRAEAASATAARLALQQQAIAERPALEVEMANSVYALQFAFGSTQVAVPAQDVGALIDQARTASLVMLRARTDGHSETPGESRIARERAIAVREYLVQSGIQPERIRMTWQPVGDYVGDNETLKGRALNRRVEIELYRFAPQRLSANASPSAM